MYICVSDMFVYICMCMDGVKVVLFHIAMHNYVSNWSMSMFDRVFLLQYYHLCLCRGYPIPVQNMYMHRNNRSAGGTHTVTHAYRKLRMVTAPFGSTAHTTEQSTHRYGYEYYYTILSYNRILFMHDGKHFSLIFNR